MPSRLVEIWTTAERGGAPVSREEAEVTPTGLAGDRYAVGQGTFSGRYPADGRALSLIHADAAALLPPGTHRRNLVIAGVEIADLVGETFTIGTVTLRGVRHCPPCGRLDRLAGADARALLHTIGGLRADVVTPGTIQPGDEIQNT